MYKYTEEKVRPNEMNNVKICEKLNNIDLIFLPFKVKPTIQVLSYSIK